MFTITETLHHGDYRATTTTNVPDLTARSVSRAVAASPYGYTASPAILDKLASQLAAGERAGHGWSWFVAVESDETRPTPTPGIHAVRGDVIDPGDRDDDTVSLTYVEHSDETVLKYLSHAEARTLATELDAATGGRPIVSGVIEWGSQFDDSDPGVIVGYSIEDVSREAARRTVEFVNALADGPTAYGMPELADLPTLDLDDHVSVATWLEAWHEETTQAWLTITTHGPDGDTRTPLV